ncbi:MAG TPA: hypothetical protein DHN29_03270 [Cytophagales bacterium]|nr:hypothetical protein [Cytophagales bacterium]|tara:strand:- start:2986 stop:3306 length:321 start_codon:yes stop_codon:yes gene_type:complete
MSVTRAQVNTLAVKALRSMIRDSNDPNIIQCAIRAIVHVAKKTGTKAVANEMLKEIYEEVEGKNPSNSRDFLVWVRRATARKDDSDFNTSIEDAEIATGPVDINVQ